MMVIYPGEPSCRSAIAMAGFKVFIVYSRGGFGAIPSWFLWLLEKDSRDTCSTIKHCLTGLFNNKKSIIPVRKHFKGRWRSSTCTVLKSLGVDFNHSWKLCYTFKLKIFGYCLCTLFGHSIILNLHFLHIYIGICIFFCTFTVYRVEHIVFEYFGLHILEHLISVVFWRYLGNISWVAITLMY